MNEYPLWTALITPMNEDGSVDYTSFESLLRKQEAAGNGILILGSTGEGLNLQEEEKRALVKFTKLQNLDVPMMVGIGGFNLSGQVDFIHFCNEVEPDAYLMVTPLYAKPGAEGQYEWFSELMAETEIPTMLYNVPSRTGVKLHPSVPARLAEEFDHLKAVKEASGSVEEFQAFREASPTMDFYSGDDGIMPEFAREGAVGLISVASNVWPEATHRYVELCLNRGTETIQPVWKEATKTLFMAPNPIPVKVLLEHNNWIKNDTVRLPLSLGDITKEIEEKLIVADKNVTEWFSAQDLSEK